MNFRTPEQNKQLNARMALVYPKDMIIEMKKSLALEYSNGRTAHTSELFEDECEKLIASLKVASQPKEEQFSKTKMKILAIRRSLGWSYDHLSEFIKKQTHNKRKHTRELDAIEANKLVAVMEKLEADKIRRRQ